MKETLIIGIGSVLRGDDGLGSRVIDALEKEDLPETVTLERGDLSGLDLIKYFSDFHNIIVIDAAEMKTKPGTVRVFNASGLRKSDFRDCVSTHGMGLIETLTLAEKLDIKSHITIIGVQPEDVSPSLKLTNLIAGRIPLIVKKIKELI